MTDAPQSLPRYAPDVPCPPYTYVPGQAPHPFSNAAGHSYQRHPPKSSPVDDDNWSRHTTYLYGIDLFNHGYYWEAHESWESAWHAVGRRGPIADLLKGLIKLAAAGVKVREGQPMGVVTHLRRAGELFAAASAGGASRRLGLSLAELSATAAASIAQPPPTCYEPPTIVRPLFPFVLRPGEAA